MRSGLKFSTFEMNLFTFKGRIKSFENSNWILSGVQSVPNMAKSGFFHMPGTQDVVICPYCDLHLHKWTNEDIPILEHIKWNPECPFIKRFPEGTIHPAELIMVFPRGLDSGCECNRHLGLSRSRPFFQEAQKNQFLLQNDV